MKLGKDEVLRVLTSVVVVRPDPPRGGSNKCENVYMKDLYA